MNAAHLRFCASPEWARIVRDQLLPWALGPRDLGDDALEVGAGPGLTTDVLRERVARLTAVEIDAGLARSLAARLTGTNVQVVHADGASLPFESGRFSAVATFSTLHHVPSVGRQDLLLAELCRVLRPGGLLVGSDSISNEGLDEFHDGDLYVPCDPDQMPARLAAAGFEQVSVETVRSNDGRLGWARTGFRFTAVATTAPSR